MHYILRSLCMYVLLVSLHRALHRRSTGYITREHQEDNFGKMVFDQGYFITGSFRWLLLSQSVVCTTILPRDGRDRIPAKKPTGGTAVCSSPDSFASITSAVSDVTEMIATFEAFDLLAFCLFRLFNFGPFRLFELSGMFLLEEQES